MKSVLNCFPGIVLMTIITLVRRIFDYLLNNGLLTCVYRDLYGRVDQTNVKMKNCLDFTI